jgi:hypothetical protein
MRREKEMYWEERKVYWEVRMTNILKQNLNARMTIKRKHREYNK